MKNGLMVVSTPDEINIGDYIQALASSQFFKKIDAYIERERLNSYNEEEVKIILNGWFMHEPNNWPPSAQIHPLFIAFHINSLAKEKILSPLSLSYLKHFEPIGCRDYYTTELLKLNGIDSYFSGCMTLTLGMNNKNSRKNGKCYFVDPYYNINKNPFYLIKYLFKLVLNFQEIKQISNKLFFSKNIKYLIKSAGFYSVYNKIFSDELLTNAYFIKQQGDIDKQKDNTNEKLMDKAKELVSIYTEATLVITSRIHCALPCLAVETPVIYIENAQQTEASFCRLDGLRQLFNIIEFDKNILIPKFSYNKSEKISIKTIINNKPDYKKYRELLINKCQSFIENNINNNG